jgi:hypothetical protein
MRIYVPVIAASLVLIVSSSAQIPQTPQAPTSTGTAVQRDAQAVALLQQSISAFGPVQPSDSTATGSVTITAGSSTNQGTVTVMTRGTAETSIQFQVPNNSWTAIFANGEANKVESSQTTVYSLELAATSQCLYFPLPYLYSVLSNPDYSVQYVGQEALGASSTIHIIVQNTFNSSAAYQFLSPFTTADIWFDATTSLPVKIGMVRRNGGGSAPRIPFSVGYSNYQSVSGVQYPFTVQEYYTETLWATTNIQSVVFSSGLTDNNFPVANISLEAQ